LGQLTVKPGNFGDEADFTDAFDDSNQGHSSQFHGYLAEPGRERLKYWEKVLTLGVGLLPNSDQLTGLYPIQ
jgi:hypothetical protein